MSKVKTGTRFRHVVDDCNALWEVKEKAALDIWVCEVVEEDHSEGYAGHRQPFNEETIVAALAWDDIFANAASETERWWAAQEPGTVVHYSNGFESYVRGVVTEDHQLKPTALVGAWREYDLPRYYVTGINVPHHAQKIADGEVWRPSHTTMYEANPSKYKTDPRELPELNLEPRPLTEREQQIMQEHDNILQEQLRLKDRAAALAVEFQTERNKEV